MQAASRRWQKLWTNDDKGCLWPTRTRSAQKCRQWCSILDSITMPATQLSVHRDTRGTQAEENNGRQQGWRHLQAISSVWVCVMRRIERLRNAALDATCNSLHYLWPMQCNTHHPSHHDYNINTKTCSNSHSNCTIMQTHAWISLQSWLSQFLQICVAGVAIFFSYYTHKLHLSCNINFCQKFSPSFMLFVTSSEHSLTHSHIAAT